MLAVRRSQGPQSRLRAFAMTVVLVAGCGLAPVALALAPRPGEPVAVFSPFPDAPVPYAVAASGAPILWLSGAGRIAVLDGTDPDLVAVLRRAGAVLVLAAGPLGPCLPGSRHPATLAGSRQP